MRYLFCLPAAAAALLSIAMPVQAMPITTSSAAFEAGITLVRDGCGPYGRRSHYGYCKDDRNPEIQYNPGEGRRGGYGRGPGSGGGYGRGPGFGGGYGERRCFMRETYNGPVRVCR